MEDDGDIGHQRAFGDLNGGQFTKQRYSLYQLFLKIVFFY